MMKNLLINRCTNLFKASHLCIFFLLLHFQIQAQQGEPGILKCDSVVVTCEATAATDFVMAMMDISGIGAAPTGMNWSQPAVTARHGVGTQTLSSQMFTRANLGQVFGLAYDNVGNVFVAASSVYFSGGIWGGINTVTNSYVGQVANSGSIYKITANTMTEFVELPNKGQGLGNVCYNKIHNSLYATNFHDGKIYRMDMTGTVQNVFDPNFDGLSYGTQFNYAPLGQRSWGVAVFGTTTANTVLYYSRWSIDCNHPPTGNYYNEIWSVNLDASGNPTGTETLIYKIPYLNQVAGTGSSCPNCANKSNPVADIEISTDGKRMLLAERSMNGTTSSAHASRLLELKRSGLVWAPEPVAKYPIGLWCKQNATGGCDYGDYDLKGNKVCNGSVLSMNDYVSAPGAPFFGSTAYGFEIVNPAGGDETTGKIVDLNNVPGGQDKFRIGDVDYRRCLDCAPMQNCGFFEPYGDTTCCQAGIKLTNTGGGAISSINYTVVGGVVQGYQNQSTCVVSSTVPVNVVGTTNGLINFAGGCINLTNFALNLQATTVSGMITVTFTVNFANGQHCVYSIKINCKRPPVTLCDKFDIKQCICQGAALNYIDVNILNQMIPNDPICSIKITKYDNLGNIQTTYWNAGAVILPSATAYNSPFNTIPAVGSINVVTGGLVHFQNYFTGTFTGSIGITVYHCSGDSCNTSWKPNVWNPTDIATAAVAKVKSKYAKMFATTYKLTQKQDVGNRVAVPVKFVSIGIDDRGTTAEIVAVTGAEQYPERERSDILKFSYASHARQNAFFELQEPLTLLQRDSSGAFNIVFANVLPPRIRYTLYDESGAVIGSDTIRLDSSSTTGVVNLLPNKSASADFFLVNGYPNPTNDLYNLKYVLGSSKEVTLSVADASGKEMAQYNEGKKQIGVVEKSLSLGWLSNGIYFIRLVSSDGQSSEPLRVVVSH